MSANDPKRTSVAYSVAPLNRLAAQVATVELKQSNAQCTHSLARRGAGSTQKTAKKESPERSRRSREMAPESCPGPWALGWGFGGWGHLGPTINYRRP
jgi:hypothetical protein